MVKNDVIKVAVADESTIVRTGVVAALKRIAEASVVFFEIARPDDFATRLKTYSPTALIISPSFGGHFDIGKWRNTTDPDMSETKFVALLSQLVRPTDINDYDAQLTIFDCEEDLRALLNSLSGQTEDRLTEDNGEEQLSEREKDVVRGVVKGFTNKEIASQLNISVYTVLTHRRNIARKLQIHSSIALAIYAISNKIATIDEVK